MENEKSPKEEMSAKEVALAEEQLQAIYVPDFRQTAADTRSKTCGITWKLHRSDDDTGDDVSEENN
jgi:hypothetical protein